MIEIERKFLVGSPAYRAQARNIWSIRQGFLSSHPQRVVRVRLAGGKGYLTVKGPSDPSGTTRFELEYQIPPSEANALLDLCEPEIIDKTRYEVDHQGSVFEVDEFHGSNEGLVLAEIELDSPKATYAAPEWLGKEVTGDPRYYNSQLTKQPYRSWKP